MLGLKKRFFKTIPVFLLGLSIVMIVNVLRSRIFHLGTISKRTFVLSIVPWGILASVTTFLWVRRINREWKESVERIRGSFEELNDMGGIRIILVSGRGEEKINAFAAAVKPTLLMTEDPLTKGALFVAVSE